jgi:hypothetical protein
MKAAGWWVLGLGLFGWLVWLAAIDAVQRDVSLDKWLKERLTFKVGLE